MSHALHDADATTLDHENLARAEADAAAQPSKAALLDRMRRLGQALALPIAAMPAAGLMLRTGQEDLLGRFAALHTTAKVISAAGAAVLDNLPLLFALGVGLGLARETNKVEPVIASVLSYLVLAQVLLVLNPLPTDQLGTPPAQRPFGALAGILGGLLGMITWRKTHRHRLIPPFVGYALTAAAAALAGVGLGLAYPAVDHALTTAADSIADHAVVGGGLFGFLNRLLLPLGLHTPINLVVWYLTGSCGDNVTGDVPCFLAHDPDAGTFMTGFFPIAMGGLPAAALAMWRAAHPDHRRRVATVLLPAAALCALTGVTEPVELAFAFVAFPLYLIHAVLTGLSLALTNWLGIHDGFVFSAGLFDYAFNFPIATRPLLLLPLTLLYAAVYYMLFRYLIVRFNFRTPGREADTDDATPATPTPSTRKTP
ncbi:PTS transporter subunit EIIC [Streptomyces venezuelae]|uniref:PTS transporter subunit EIIC n=1 Tax=Streptomyces venezuelae TaxID=54571 RepID=UPI0034361197